MKNMEAGCCSALKCLTHFCTRGVLVVFGFFLVALLFFSSPSFALKEQKALAATGNHQSGFQVESHGKVTPDDGYISIKKGMPVSEVAKTLKEAGLIKSIFYFKFLAWLSGKSTKIKSGEYVFTKDSSNWDILSTLVKGEVYLHPVTFPEGYNIYEIAKTLAEKNLLKREDFISLCYDSDFVYHLLGEKRDSLEGYLFPDTYYVSRPVNPRSLIRNMVRAFLSVYNKFSRAGRLSAGSGSVRLSRHEAVILASIVEKETGQAQERSLIASVFYNRLRKKMRLESDPTILYGMMREVRDLVPLNIRKKDILRKTPYNTYRLSRFPVGPISNPGEEALKAVFKPKQSDFLYFVSRNDGSHVFSKTYKEHKKAVDYYQRGLR
ncbi:MAG: endolytic transglycosylase MltG [Bdellovibrionales bacterium]|nr:endolytic transglycosylase MltG [Bdellovibrionales bacterium]